MGRGGTREGSGRKPGARNKKTEEQVKAVEESGLTPLEYMLSVMRDPVRDAGERLEAAKAAAPYVHPKLTAIHTTGGPEQKLEDWLESIPEDEV